MLSVAYEYHDERAGRQPNRSGGTFATMLIGNFLFQQAAQQIMSHRLASKDILALGFMTFALFVGAGNIIFPPMVGLQSGEHVWTAAIGFLITAVGLPVLTVIALARVGGGVDALSSPIGRSAGLMLATVCYLAVGPLFATPRTATVSFEVGIAPLTGDGPLPLFIYSLGLFCAGDRHLALSGPPA
ncbi:LIV-II [Serratia fonticola]|uniref:Branched-chain amino acid transport system carrier protein n=1 Tax=Serratia fonticola TaxID=47917 RepID=A0A4U9URT0_SERFO|nr:LIV-II [Serratia fonticola]